MISRSLLLLRRVTRQLWFRVVAISLFSLLALAVAPLLAPILPQEWENRFGRDAVLPVLNILATGMLAVTTFSLNVMVSAYRTASTMATPRVYRLLLEDTVTQSVLATFTGGFVYSLSAIILFRARLYPPGAAFVVFVMTVLVVALIVIAILRWIDHLSDLGSMDHTLRLIETRTRNSLQARKDTPSLGGCCDTSEPPADARPIAAAESGFVRFVDMPALNARAEEAGVTIHLTRLPGEFVLRGRPLAMAQGADKDFCTEATGLIDIGDVRSFEQDPAFGLTLLAETAQRALSPGVNDPGTAIEVMGRIERLLWETLPDGTETEGGEVRFPHIHLPPVTAQELLKACFPPIARCAEDAPEVMQWMDKALSELEHHPNTAMTKAARKMHNSFFD
ncbi:DUF2254 domain-containing protein [Tritonibacter scottomollicae]|uniref:DUF2254 domain-containing protein n=1 Tax=Tritonibacter scottomollicae TaxID=483013 RepID=A0ABZ0HH71_TRISK|nr:DUF2254 domain-containing protein [Tritonibacter scottomollicae]WOI33271.1 DUF2254 domain-containing protein [Tritonibacter scottomollicae]